VATDRGAVAMDALNGLDLAIVLAIGLSALLGLVRGLLREMIALAGWVAAVVLAIRYAAPVGALLPFQAAWPALKTLLGGGIIVVACVFSAALVGWVVRRLLRAARLSAADRALGGVFGVLRGVVIVLVAVLFAGGTPLARQPAWDESVLLPWAERGVQVAAPWLPPALAGRGGARQ
jgi:membrane protein required for colicin V production